MSDEREEATFNLCTHGIPLDKPCIACDEFMRDYYHRYYPELKIEDTRTVN